MSSTSNANAFRQSRGDRQGNMMPGSNRQSPMRNRSYGGNGQSGSRKPQQPQQVKKIATGLGWFSIGLGVAELIATAAWNVPVPRLVRFEGGGGLEKRADDFVEEGKKQTPSA